MIEEAAVYEFEGFSLDVKKQRLSRGDDVILLPPKAIELLTLMVANQGRPLEKDDLIETLWHDTFVEDANLTQTVYLLRKALGKTASGENLIATLPKRGYKFTAAVHRKAPAETIRSFERTTVEQISISREETERITIASVVPDAIEQPMLQDAPKSAQRGLLQTTYAWIALPLIVLLGGLAAVIAWRANDPAPAAGKVKTLVVVPFKTIGTDGTNDYLGLGLADSLITRLSKTGKINVRSTEDIYRHKNAASDPLDLGRTLGADVVLTGTLQQAGDSVRLNAQLLNVSDGSIAWSNQFDKKVADMFAMQDAITRDLTQALTLRLTEEEQTRINRNTTENLEALKLYWEGRFYWNRRTPEWIAKGIECFTEAVRLDPAFAQGYAGLADSYALSVSGLPPKDRFPKAKAAAERALQLDGNLAEAHASLAIIAFKYDWDENASEEHFRRALELNELYPTAHHWYGEFLALQGRFDEGLAELRRAEELDPFSIAIKTDIVEALYRARRYEEAESKAQGALGLDPSYVQIYRILMHIYERQPGGEEKVMKTDLQIQRLLKTSPDKLDQLEDLAKKATWKEYWRLRLKLIESTDGKEQYIVEKAEIHTLLGDARSAVDELRSKLEGKEVNPLMLRTDPVFDPLRGDPKFGELIK